VTFTFGDLIELYAKKKELYGDDTYRHISEILKEAKILHKKYFMTTGKSDHEQSWRAFKGKNLERLVVHILTDEIHALGLKVVFGNTLEQTSSSNLDRVIDKVKRNLLVDYGEFGMHLPDVDIIIFDPSDRYILAVVSVKVTLRERIAQTGYWKLKLSNAPVTKDIKVYFITPDEDGTLSIKKPTKKGRAIVETDTDGSYIMSEVNVEETAHVKKFDRFIADVRNIVEAKKGRQRL
jgi:type II restriction enzyme